MAWGHQPGPHQERHFEAAGCDLLFCLLDPCNMIHEQNMSALERIGKHMIPEFDE